MKYQLERNGFSKLVNNFIIQVEKRKIEYQRRTICDLFVEEKTQSLLKNALSSPDRLKRIDAIVTLGKVANTSFEIEILQRLGLNDPDLMLKFMAKEAVEAIKNRLA